MADPSDRADETPTVTVTISPLADADAARRQQQLATIVALLRRAYEHRKAGAAVRRRAA